MRLLLVEDDFRVADPLITDLKRAGYVVDHSGDGIDAEFMGDEVDYDAVVLDLGLPGRPGLEVLANWRGRGMKAPVLVLTARDGWRERVDGLKAGADDYVGKPFHVEELLARLEALLRRADGGRAAGPLVVGPVTLDEGSRELVNADGERSRLTGTEFRLLRRLMIHPGDVVSKRELTAHAYPDDAERDSNVIEVYIRRLRQKLGDTWIETRRGQGYRFRVDR
jgi:DNA-binding response OmpR family regulator